jgi:hypothetical protein
MPSKVGIVNAAFRKLGEAPITAVGEDNKAGRLSDERYDEVRDALLHRHPWNFAMKRDSLAPSATDPEWGFDHAYPLPTDYIRMYSVNGQDMDSNTWSVENGHVVTNLDAPIEIRYVYQVTDPALMTPGFREALASMLAADWANDITGDDQVVSDQNRFALRAIAQARSNDGQEGMPDKFISDEWTNARF